MLTRKMITGTLLLDLDEVDKVIKYLTPILKKTLNNRYHYKKRLF